MKQKQLKKHKKHRSRHSSQQSSQRSYDHRSKHIDKNKHKHKDHKHKHKQKHHKAHNKQKQQQNKRRRISSDEDNSKASSQPNNPQIKKQSFKIKREYQDNQQIINQKIQTKKQDYHKQQQQQYGGWQSDPQVKQQNIKMQNAQAEPQPIKKQQPCFQPSGILLQYYNAREGIALKFHEPPQAHTPLNQWRIYPFKDNNPIAPIILKQSCYLIGKDDRICDILCQNQSISRQHAVIQFRSQYKNKVELQGGYQMQVKPYIMDLGSTNGTKLNDEQIQSSRYYELLNKDILKFGLSTRQYVIFKVQDNGKEDL